MTKSLGLGASLALGLGLGAGIGALTRPSTTRGGLLGLSPTRRVFFSFHYKRDIWRVQQVKNHWIAKPNRLSAGYFDGSLTEKAKKEGDLAVKRLINAGMKGSSVTCVLIGAETYTRKWVDYEIFRSVELGMGVFGVRIHGLRDSNRRIDDPGPNPFTYLGYGSSDGKNLLPYVKYKKGWTICPNANNVTPAAAAYLSEGSKPILGDIFSVYDWVADDGYSNFSRWVSAAAKQASR